MATLQREYAKRQKESMKSMTGRGECATACPIKKIPSEFNTGLGLRSAIYIPFPQAVLNKPYRPLPLFVSPQTGKMEILSTQVSRQCDPFRSAGLGDRSSGRIGRRCDGFQRQGTSFFPEYGYGKYKES